MTLNVKGLDETLTHIEAHPEQHDQGVWTSQTECGTTACFAGWHLILTNQVTTEKSNFESWFRLSDHLRTLGWSEAARQSLGLTHGQAMELFHRSTDLEDVRRTVTAIKAGDDFPEVLASEVSEEDPYDVWDYSDVEN